MTDLVMVGDDGAACEGDACLLPGASASTAPAPEGIAHTAPRPTLPPDAFATDTGSPHPG